MSILAYHEYIDTPVACFGDSLEEAKEEAIKKMNLFNSTGHIAFLDDQGFLMRDHYYDKDGNKVDKDLYAWNVQVKKVMYR